MPAESSGERIAKLETNMQSVLDVLSRRESYQNTVLEALTTIKLKQEEFLNYQKTCEAKREAHDIRITSLENARRMEESNRRLLRAQAALIGALASLVVAALGLFFKH